MVIRNPRSPLADMHHAKTYKAGAVDTTEMEKVHVIMCALIFVYIILKVVFYFKINDSMGLMSTLLVGVFVGVIPFLIIFFTFVTCFAILTLILGGNQNLAEGYSGMPLAFGYFFQTFENGIGNISAPSINFLSDKSALTTLDYVIVYSIYFCWFMAQIILLIVLLNFVIALIS